MGFSKKLTIFFTLFFSTIVGGYFFYSSPSALVVKSNNDSVCPSNSIWSDENLAKWLHKSIQEIKAVKVARSLDNRALCAMPAKKLAQAFEKTLHKPRPDSPGEAAEFRAAQQSVYGYLKPDGLINATIERKQLVQNLVRGGNAIVGAAGISSSHWSSIGPGNIGGRIRTIFIHPGNSNIIFAGSVGGGIWKSSDGGNSWSAVNDFMGNITVTSIAADPRTTGNVNTTVLYTSTGEGFYNGDALRGYGVFKSTDGGTTWSHLSSTDPTVDSDWYYVNRIAINSNGDIIAVARGNAIFTSHDGGATWSKKSPGPHYYSMMEDVKFDPNHPNKAIVGSIGGDCYYTTDTGDTWTKSHIADSSGWAGGRVELAYAKDANDTLYASVDKNQGAIYKSVDGGVSWSYISTPSHLGNQGWYANTIWVDPTDMNHLVVGGLDLWSSTDGGNNWTQISTWSMAPNSPHADHHTIVNDPNYNGTSNKRVYIGNDGGIYKSDDITSANKNSSNNGWTNLNNGLAITQFYGGAGVSGSKIIGGAQDNGSLLHNGSGLGGWIDTFGGDGGFAAVAPKTVSGQYYYFNEYVYLQIHRSDNGSSGTYIYSNGLDDANSNANFIAPFTLDPNNRNVMLAGGASLWKSSNVRASNVNDIAWSKIKDSISGTKISQIAIDESNSDIIVVGYNDGEIYKTTNGTSAQPSWTKIHDSNGKYVLALLIDKDNPNILYAGWGGYASGNVKKSTDSGVTWSDISGNLPQAPVRSIVRNPNNANYLYIGTEVGVFTSENQGSSWFTTNDGPANVSVDQLFWYDTNTLVAVTHGRGIFKTTVNTGSGGGGSGGSDTNSSNEDFLMPICYPKPNKPSEKICITVVL
ncbi:MAG: WD40/YVTN/BNR-like repeat-containing protein [bacterium]